MNYADGTLIEQLTHVGAHVVARGLVVGSGGNLSAREPGARTFVVTGAGTWLDRLRPNDFARVSLTNGRRTSGATATTELGLHLATYRARPDVNAIIHLHPQSVLLLDALGLSIRLATTDHDFYLREIAVVPFAPPGSARLADLAATAAADVQVLSRHGCSVLADSVELAHKRALYLEEAAQLTFRAALLRRRLPALPKEYRDALAAGDVQSV